MTELTQGFYTRKFVDGGFEYERLDIKHGIIHVPYDGESLIELNDKTVGGFLQVRSPDGDQVLVEPRVSNEIVVRT